MKKPIKITLISLAAIIGIIVIAGGSFFFFLRHELKTLNPIPTGNIVDGVFAVGDDGVNMYLIQSDSGYIAIDAGQSSDAMMAGIEKLAIDPANIRTILLTHTDYDHIATIPKLPQATVYISDAEEQLINGKIRRSPFFQNQLTCPYQLVADNQELLIDGVSIKCLLTPGHTVGSTCYLVNGKYLFVGDTMGLQNDKAVPFIKLFNMDSNQAKESMKKIAGVTGAQYVFTGHHGYTDNPHQAFAGVQ